MNNISKATYSFQHNETITEFISAMRAAGLEPPITIIADGAIHRFTLPGDKKSSKNGWYILYPDFPPAGAFGCWKRNIKHTFSPPIHHNHVKERLKQIERSDHINHIINRTMEKQAAVDLWRSSSSATNGCKYLRKKKVKSHGLRYHKNALLIPVMDIQGNIYGVQRIWPNGVKRFTQGTEKRGHFFLIGSPDQSSVILIAEGYATAATLNEVTGCASVVAFDLGNLLPVARNISSANPHSRIVVCCDDDHSKPGNPGMTKAAEATASVDGILAVPLFLSTRGECDTDFNDLYVLEGADAVMHSLRVTGVI
jgi:putative DNA primase/helicase